MPLNSKLGLFGLAKQTVKGTQVTPPLYSHGLSSGGLAHDRSLAPQALSSGARTTGQTILSSQSPGATVQSPAYVAALGLYLLAAMGVDTVTGTTPAYTHTFSHGALPWMSLYQSLGGSEYMSVYDAKCSELKLSWSVDEPVLIDTTWVALNEKPAQASFTATTPLDQSAAFLSPIGGTFQLDASTGTPVTATVLSGDMTVTNTMDVETASGSTMPAFAQEGDITAACSLVVVPDDLGMWQRAITGVAARGGTTPAESPIYGSFAVTLKENLQPTNYAILATTGAKVMWDCAYPSPSTAGAAVQLSWAGIPVASAGGTPLAFALTNTVATY